MAETIATVGSTVGLHARPAALLAEAAADYDLEITIALEGEPAEDLPAFLANVTQAADPDGFEANVYAVATE